MRWPVNPPLWWVMLLKDANRIIPFLLKKNKGGGNALFDCVLIWEGEQQAPQTHSINNIDHLLGPKHWAWRGCAHAQCLPRTHWV